MIKRCSNCGKRIWFWNSFNRKYGSGRMFDKELKSVELVWFCSEDCCFEYKDNLNIDFRKK